LKEFRIHFRWVIALFNNFVSIWVIIISNHTYFLFYWFLVIKGIRLIDNRWLRDYCRLFRISLTIDNTSIWSWYYWLNLRFGNIWSFCRIIERLISPCNIWLFQWRYSIYSLIILRFFEHWEFRHLWIRINFFFIKLFKTIVVFIESLAKIYWLWINRCI
jgi:hypothetical protein